MRILNTLIDGLLWPFLRLPPEAGLVAFSVFFGLVVLLIFKATSNAGRVVQARNRALARILEMWLYRDDPWVSLGAFGRLLVDNARYLAVMTLPLLASLLPAVLLLAQAHDWFAMRPIRPGEAVLVVAETRPEVSADASQRMQLSVYEAGAGASAACVRVEGAPVWTPVRHEIAWRVRADERLTGRATLVLQDTDGALRVEKRICTGSRLARITRMRVAGLAASVLYPGEARLEANQPVVRVEVLYAEAEYSLLGWRMGWLPAVIILSMLAGLALQKPLRVEF